MKQSEEVAGALAVLTIAAIAMTGCDSDETGPKVDKAAEMPSTSSTPSPTDESSKPDPGDRYGDVSGPGIDEIEGTRYSGARDSCHFQKSAAQMSEAVCTSFNVLSRGRRC